MAAGSLFINIESQNDLKRKRRNDEEDDNANQIFATKRRNFSQLPIRSPPPTRPTISVTPAFGQHGMSPGILTPDSIPEDEEFQSSHLWSHQHSYTSGAQSRSSISDNSNHEQLSQGTIQQQETVDDVDMDISSPKLSQHPTPIRIGRARSNDLMSPIRTPMNHRLLLGPSSPTHQTSFAQARVATPVASSFPARSPFEASFASATARQMRPHLLTTLSPMVNTESWTPQIHHPPSPEPDLDSAFSEDATMVGMEDSHMMSSSFGALSVHSQDDLDVSSLDSSPVRTRSSQTSASSMSSFSTQGLGLDGSNRMDDNSGDLQVRAANTSEVHHQHNRNMSNSGRTARLHMGYRADCEKCVKRVHGHYSHIIWS